MPVALRAELRLAAPDDLPVIAEFLLGLGGPLFPERYPGKRPEDFYRWKYFQNPLGNAIVAIAVAGDRVVSAVAGVPKRLALGTEVVLVYELGDFLTAADFRRRGFFSRLIEMVCHEAAAKGAAFVYVRPNENSFPILVRHLSFFEARRGDSRRFVTPSYFISRRTGISSSLLRISGMDWVARKALFPSTRRRSVLVERVARFGSEAETLWERARKGYKCALVRDQQYLNWRFSDCPTPYTVWLARRSDGVAGYLVSFVHVSTTLAHVLDLFAETSDVEAAQALLSTSFEQMRQEGIRSIYTWTLQSSAESSAHRVLCRSCPVKEREYLHIVFRALRPEFERTRLPSEKWHLSAGDFDGF